MCREVVLENVDECSSSNVLWFARLCRIDEQSAGRLSRQTELRHVTDQCQDLCFEKLLVKSVHDLADVGVVDA